MIKEIIIDGIRIASWVNDAGFVDGRKYLVFIHGSGGEHTLWESQYRALEGDFNIAAVNLPGHGLSGGGGEKDVMAYVEWVKKMIAGLGIRRPPILIGHSLGAAISLTFAIHYGYLLSAIVPVGGGVTMPVNPALLSQLKTDPETVYGLIVKFAVAKIHRDRVGPGLIEGLRKGSPEILHDDLFACDKLDVTEAVKKISIPVLVICGDDDKMTPPALSRYIADNVPGGRLALIPGAGHFVMNEEPEVFNNVLKEFILSLQ
ncbi:MAG TPA: alpha/beta hydrolase [Syntrophales bacterium]|jgi:pimeloyl-ACP methyl ester carboxylesterase|nr:alpha/beta hydrolase [Syntrophales bacterium]HRT61933.1 alpha/beta hydrolase [Syntrophales bacterium]